MFNTFSCLISLYCTIFLWIVILWFIYRCRFIVLIPASGQNLMEIAAMERFNKKNVDVLNTYFPHCVYIVRFKGDTRRPFSTSCYDSLGSSWKVYNILWLKFFSGSVKTTPFLPCQKQLCSQWPVSVHVPLNANELLLTPLFHGVTSCSLRLLTLVSTLLGKVICKDS